MRAPKRKHLFKRELLTKEAIKAYRNELDEAADIASYIGSPEHKKTPSFAGHPKPRADASICPDSLAKKQGQVTDWLKKAIKKGSVADWWQGKFPKYVWYKEKESNIVFEGRLINKVSGEYKGWPLNYNEWPERIDEFYE